MGGGPVASVQSAQNVQLFPDVVASDGGEDHQSLIMTWENNDMEDPGILNVAAWDYVYGLDPDLTGTLIEVSIFPPPGVWDVSMELYDINGFSRGWFGTLPNTWGTYLIDPTIVAAQGPFLASFSQPGFDLTQVTRIRLNESTQGGTTFIDSPLVGRTR